MRLAYIKAMPSEDDLLNLGVNHAGEYLQWLRAFPEEEKKFTAERSLNFNEKLDQPIEQKLKHFIEWMLYAVRGGAPTEHLPQSISKQEAQRFKAGLVARIAVKESDAEQEPGGTLGSRQEIRPAKGAPDGPFEEIEYAIKDGAKTLDEDSNTRSLLRQPTHASMPNLV